MSICLCDRKYWCHLELVSKWPFCHALVTSAMRVTHWHIYYLNSTDWIYIYFRTIKSKSGLCLCIDFCHWSIQRNLMMKFHSTERLKRNRKEFTQFDHLYWRMNRCQFSRFVCRETNSIDQSITTGTCICLPY